jgi:hypothetical protein
MSHLSQSIRQRILRRCAKGKPFVVVPRGGRPSRLYGIDSYLKTVEKAKSVKPWTHRKAQKNPDPLKAVRGRIVSPLRREDIYG